MRSTIPLPTTTTHRFTTTSMMTAVHLEPEQQELLCRFVEADRRVSSGRRGKFVAIVPGRGGPAVFILRIEGARGIQLTGSLTDAEILAYKGLLGVSFTKKGTSMFHVMPEGLQYYRELKQVLPPVEAVEGEIQRFLSSDEFRRIHGAAFEKWSSAASLLWGSDSQKQYTTVGHLCREAMQEFADQLVRQYKPPEVDLDKAHIVARVRSVLQASGGNPGSTEKGFLDALLAYWGTVSDLVQRQEHDAQKEGESLEWEDARRVVFQTCVVMYEVHRALTRRG